MAEYNVKKFQIITNGVTISVPQTDIMTGLPNPQLPAMPHPVPIIIRWEVRNWSMIEEEKLNGLIQAKLRLLTSINDGTIDMLADVIKKFFVDDPREFSIAFGTMVVDYKIKLPDAFEKVREEYQRKEPGFPDSENIK